MKKTVLIVFCICAAMVLCARPPFHSAPPHRHGSFHHVPPPPLRHHHTHHIHGVWPEAVGAMVGIAIAGQRPAVVIPPPPVVVPSPVTRQVWVEGRYVDVIGPNGVVIRQWQPGHWEYRSVILP